jgi:hypothetical protein
MRRLCYCVVLVFMVGLSQNLVQAQTTGSMTGTISDPNGALVAGANVLVKNNDTGLERSTVTKEDGVFNVTALLPGSYSVAVEAPGFKRTLATNVAVEVSQQAQLTIQLEVGLTGETVTVTSAQDVINSSSPSLTNVINTRQVIDLPLPTRNPLDLAALQAGIAVVGNATRTADGVDRRPSRFRYQCYTGRHQRDGQLREN